MAEFVNIEGPRVTVVVGRSMRATRYPFKQECDRS
jgi:hypothetical protein